MNRDDIIRMAQEANYANSPLPEFLERFAALVAAHEREACAKACDEEASGINSKDGKIMALMIGERIRVRGVK